ncbi:hypothetical protein [Actinoplanes utahensis]|nr:hypothetical protein [Actinoplanes utahensis]
MKKVLNYVTAAVVAAAGLTVATAAPAFAAGGCSASTNPTVVVCVNHGDDGAKTRGDFYINRAPDWSVARYSEHFVVNGVENYQTMFGAVTRTGRYCCSYVTRNRGTKIKNRVKIYTASGAVHMTVDSPTITVP